MGTAAEDTSGIGKVSVFREVTPGQWSFVHSLARTGDGVGEATEGLGLTDSFAVVGSYLADDGANGNVGAVYGFAPNGVGIFQEVEVLRAGDRATGDNLGTSVGTVDGLVVVGAPGKDAFAGAAYVFEKIGSAWLAQRLPQTPVASERFGASVATADERIVVVGAPKSANGTSGKAYVYVGGGAGWTQAQTLTGSAEVWRFGNHVAVYGDVIVVASATTVYMFRRQGGIWLEEQNLVFETIYDVAAGDEIIGVAGFKSGLGDTVWLLQRNGATWMVTEELRQGTSVDFDGERIAVGSQYKDGTGAAEVYELAR